MKANSSLRVPRAISVAAAIALLAACSAGDAADNAGPRARGTKRQPNAGAIETPGESYRTVAVANGGNISGRVVLEGQTSPDSATIAQQAASPCGPADSIAALSSGGPAGVVVWISDARQGRSLPMERRVEIVQERCVLGPRVQTAVVGSTINVMNVDAMVSRFRAVRDGTFDTLAVFRFSDPGQVVPSEVIAKSQGLVAFRGEDRSIRGWLAVFDHPYFAVTTGDGSFRIDSIPPGKYHVKAWHERTPRPVESTVEVRAGSTTELELKVPAGPPDD